MGPSGFSLEPGETPLSDEEKLGLKPSYITTQEQLNQFEQSNILLGTRWAMQRKRGDVLSEKFIKTLHRKMFGETWSWAGKFRQSGKNLGVLLYQISTEVRKVLDDVRAWEAEDTFNRREIAIRLHHRVVAVHPFANGNGRHTRLLADVYLYNRSERPFSWSKGASLRGVTAVRSQYIEALRQADKLNYKPLLDFAED